MRNCYSLLAAAFILFAAAPLKSQHAYDLVLRAGYFSLTEQSFDLEPDAEEIVADHFYRIVQFYEIPDARERAEWEARGWTFLRYFHHKSYLVSLPIGIKAAEIDPDRIRAVSPFRTEWKIHPQLMERPLGAWAAEGNGKVRINVIGQADIQPAEGRELLREQGFEPLFSYKHLAFYKIAVEPADFAKVAQLPFVEFIELVPPPPVKDDDLARALHRANQLDADYGAGRKYDGTGIRTLVRDDGEIPDLVDFKGRMVDLGNDEDFFFGGGTHGDQVAGVIGGAGNIDPEYRGMAVGATIYNLNYQSEFTDTTLDLHLNDTVVITNSSYSNGCNAGYTFAAFNVDQQLRENRSFMHVFSAGNSNNNDCGYGAGNQWGNVTGGHKIAKNCLTTANLFYNGELVNSSSRGPTEDGRIKPDISANGAGQVTPYPGNTYDPFGGTSAASPGIAGVMAQLYHAYRSMHGGQYPASALIKAVMLNTANDLGNRGPDYKFGWGHINGLKAVETLEENRYWQSVVDQGGSNFGFINVPDGVAEVKIMLYWHEAPASTAGGKVLLNDLDLRVMSPDSSEHLPWVLSFEPNPTVLDQPATKGRDSMNNVEQVVIENPESGQYDIFVDGFEVPLGPQAYTITYEFIYRDKITLIYPAGGEGLIPADDSEVIHWDAYGEDGNFLLEYSSDGGMSWEIIDTVFGNTRIYDWTVPEEATGRALVRVSRNGFSDQSNAPFTVAHPPADLRPKSICPESITFTWDSVDVATGYEFFQLGEKYMDSIGHTDLTEFTVPADFPYTEPIWVAVNTRGENDLRSRRSVAVPFQENDLKACSTARDLSLLGSPRLNGPSVTFCEAFEEGLELTLVNQGFAPATNISLSYRLNEEAVVTEIYTDTLQAGDTLTYLFSQTEQITTGEDSLLQAWISWGEDEFPYNDTMPELRFSVFIYDQIAQTPISENFNDAETDFPDQWRIVNPDSFLTWETTLVTGPNGLSTTAMYVNNYSYSNSDMSEDFLIMPPIQLPDEDNLLLQFDYAYTYYNDNYWDGLRIDLSTDCGRTYPHVLFEKFKDELITTPPQTGAFNPDADEWKEETLDLSAFAGQDVIIRFVNISDYGNQMYLDNVNIGRLSPPVAAFELENVLYCAETPIEVTNLSGGNFLDYEWTLPADAIVAAGSPVSGENWEILFFEAGDYELQLIVTNLLGSDTTSLSVSVQPQPAPDFNFSVDGLTVTFENQSIFSTTYQWDFGDGNTSNEEDPVHTYAAAGDYEVSLTAQNICGDRTSSNGVETTPTYTTFAEAGIDLQIMPNPSDGRFSLLLSGNLPPEEISIQLWDLQGRQVALPRNTAQEGDQLRFDFQAAHLPAGAYLLRGQFGEHAFSRSLIIAK